MEKQKLSNLYPTATRGDLKTSPAVVTRAPKKSFFRARDHEPSTIIAMTVAAAIAFCIIGLTLYIVTAKGYFRALMHNSQDY